MYNCHADITKFHNLHVSLGTTQRNTMRNRRNANRDRLEKGLKNNDDPSVKKFVSQGSYSMHTMVQDDNHDYDIDDGVVFKKADLVGKNGSDKSALDARKMVRDAVDDGSFNKEPVTLKNCVRIYYNDGPHVDMPVYRELDDETLELASADWKGSSPTEITTWFNDSVIAQSPDEINGRQMRRIVKLLKTFTKSRDSWKSNMPSGFKISVLVDEKYQKDEYREDTALYDTMVAIRDRLETDKVISHPTRDELLTKSAEDADLVFFLKKLNWSIDKLSVLFDDDCSEKDALKAWNHVFKHQYFEDRIAEIEENEKEEIAKSLRVGNSKVSIGAGLVGILSAEKATASLKETRAFGGADYYEKYHT